MSYRELNFRITGVAPLLLHNGQTADPMNSFAKSIKAISAKKKKTDADFAEMSRIEWYAGLYLSGGQPCVPSEMLEAAIVAGAKKNKRGPDAKAALIVEKHSQLEYDGPTAPDDLWQDERFVFRVPVKVGMSKVVRTRPRFNEWAAEVAVSFLPSLLNERDVKSFLVAAGEQVGIGDWRPRFGRFVVV